jgi:outer membrane protein assembly factor BamB
MTTGLVAEETLNVVEKWVARYGATVDAFHIARDIVVDVEGNVFVTGYEGYWNEVFQAEGQRWATVKYDSKGSELWVQKYEDPGRGWAQAYSITSDGTGGVYVTDYYHIIRYSSDGAVLWEKDIADIGIKKMTGLRGWGAHPEVDSDGNYIFALSIATDWVPNPWDPQTQRPGIYDIHVVKFRKSDGQETLLARYTGPGKLNDQAWGLLIDEDDNIYVVGYTERSQTGDDLLVMKYGPDGDVFWMTTYHNELLNGYDTGNCVALDNDGNVYVAGSTGSYDLWEEDAVTLKLDPQGELLWDATYSAPDSWRTKSMNLVVDSRGDVYMEGYNGWADVHLVKYDSDSGNELWVQHFASPTADFPPEGNGLIVDRFDDIYLTTLLNEEIYSAKLDPYGNVLWEAVYNHPDSPTENPQAITMDDEGNVYVTGDEDQIDPEFPDRGPQPRVAVTIKYKQPGY